MLFRSAHVQLDDDPRTPIQQSVGEEFHQHDGVVTILMYYRRRASPKHRYNIIEDYGGRGRRTRLRIRSCGSTCLSGVPLPPYINDQGGGCGRPGEGVPGGVLLPPGVGFPPFLVGIGFGRGKEEREKEGGAAPLSLSYSD